MHPGSTRPPTLGHSCHAAERFQVLHGKQVAACGKNLTKLDERRATTLQVSRELFGLSISEARRVQHATMLEEQSCEGCLAAEFLLKLHRRARCNLRTGCRV